jgi:chorismate-pyruvate lyase
MIATRTSLTKRLQQNAATQRVQELSEHINALEAEARDAKAREAQQRANIKVTLYVHISISLELAAHIT